MRTFTDQDVEDFFEGSARLNLMKSQIKSLVTSLLGACDPIAKTRRVEGRRQMAMIPLKNKPDEARGQIELSTENGFISVLLKHEDGRWTSLQEANDLHRDLVRPVHRTLPDLLTLFNHFFEREVGPMADLFIKTAKEK